MRVDFNIHILNTLLERYPERAIEAKNKFPKIDNWLAQTSKPTINQLENLSKMFGIPFGYFFLQHLPERKYPISHYRTMSNETFKPSIDLMDVIETIQERQEWARDLLMEWREEKLDFANSISLQTPLNEAVLKIREVLDLPVNWANNVLTWAEALKFLVERAETTGIFTVINGIVNNNTKRKLDVNEFRGFVLYDDYAPFIFINNNDAISGKIFTLIHEIAHVLLGKSASFDLRQLQPADDAIEKYCDKTAAEFLVPEEQLQKQLQTTGKNYEALAKTFKVSQIVIARRLLDLKILSRNQFFEFYENHMKKEFKQKNSTGGNFYNTIPYRISKRFFRVVNSALKQNKMLYKDAFRLTTLKPKTFDRYLQEHLE
ncbi:MAG: ImmA/IrrE family metallo-endopeptidase [Bacteroidales bacterium]|nr:ImmA/IrrE family metallo-endopeptidase [Bacteroidales bacterium]